MALADSFSTDGDRLAESFDPTKLGGAPVSPVPPQDGSVLRFNAGTGQYEPIPLQSPIVIQGNWNALTNTPDLTVLTPPNGYAWVVTVAGTTNLGGITGWQVGDFAISLGGGAWAQQSNAVTSVNGLVGAVVLGAANIGLVTVPGMAATQLQQAIQELYTLLGKTIRVSTQPGSQFTSIKAACDYVATQSPSPTNPFGIRAEPGSYPESPFTIPPSTMVYAAAGFNSVVISATDNSNHLITLSPGSFLARVAVDGPTDTGKAAIRHNTASNTPSFLKDVLVRKGYHGLLNDTATGGLTGIVHCFNFGNQYNGSTISDFIHVEGNSNVAAMVAAFMSGPAGSCERGFVATGPEAELTLDMCAFRNADGVTVHPIGVYADDGAHIRVTGCSLRNGHTALKIGPNGADTHIDVSGTVVNHDNFTYHIDIQSATGVVTFSGNANKNKINNPHGVEIAASFSDITPGEQGQVVLGELWLGTQVESVPLGALTRETTATGYVAGGEATRGAGRVVNIAAGSGYVNTGTGVKRVVWSAGSVTIPADSEKYIHADSAGVLFLSDTEQEAVAVVIAHAVANATDVVFLTKHTVCVDKIARRLHEFIREVLGPLAFSGILTTPNAVTPLHIDVSSGEYYIGLTEHPADQQTDAVYTLWYRDGSGGWISVPGQTAIDVVSLDDGTGVLGTLPLTKFRKDLTYTVESADGTATHIVLGQTVFDDEVAANTGPVPLSPAFLTDDALRTSAIVVEQGMAGLLYTIFDVRPLQGQRAPVSVTVVNHDDLNLRDTPANHPWALPIDGSRAMTAALNMGGQNIANVGTVDSVDVSGHAARHGAGGLDALPAGSVANSQLATVPTATLKGRVTAGTGVVEDLPAADIRTVANVYSKAEVDALIDPTLKAPEAFTPAGTYPVTYGGQAVQQGDSFRIAAAGAMGAVTVNPEDLLIALIDTPAQVDANWQVLESNRDQATETVKGVAETATQAETDAGTDDLRIMTPLKHLNAAQFVGDTGAGGGRGHVPAPAAGDAAERKVLYASGAWGTQNIRQSLFAERTATISTTATTWTAPSLLSLSITTLAGSSLKIAFDASGRQSNDEGVFFRVRVDGVVKRGCGARFRVDERGCASLTLKVPGMTAGVHTVDVQWRNALAGTATIKPATAGDPQDSEHASLLVEETLV